MKSICFPPSAFCLLTTAYCVGGGGMESSFHRHSSLGQDVTTGRERKKQ
jgi:hypothetical protein